MIQIMRYQLVKYSIFPLTFLQISKFIEITHHDYQVISIQGGKNEKKKKKDVLPKQAFLIVFCPSVRGKIIVQFKTYGEKWNFIFFYCKNHIFILIFNCYVIKRHIMIAAKKGKKFPANIFPKIIFLSYHMLLIENITQILIFSQIISHMSEYYTIQKSKSKWITYDSLGFKN